MFEEARPSHLPVDHVKSDHNLAAQQRVLVAIEVVLDHGLHVRELPTPLGLDELGGAELGLVALE